MTPSEVTRELVSLIDEAAVHERDLIHHSIMGRLPDGHMSSAQLRHLSSGTPINEQRKTLLLARRLIAVGQRQYEPLDPKRDGRDYHTEVIEELIDAYVYLVAHLIRSGKPSPLQRDAVNLMRDAMDLALRLDAV